MKNIKDLLKGFFFSVVLFFILSFAYTIISYFNLFSSNVNNIIKLVIPILVFFVGGFLAGKKALKNGWLEGVKISFILSIIMIIFTFVLNTFKFEYLLYILILTISGVFGSIMGINKKAN